MPELGSRAYCGAPPPKGYRPTACCVLGARHGPDVQHRNLDGLRWLSEGSPMPEKTVWRNPDNCPLCHHLMGEHTVMVDPHTLLPIGWRCPRA